MTCVSPPELEETALLSFLAGEADQGVEDHLELCSHCSQRAATLKLMEAGLKSGLYRVDCPRPQTLVEYQSGFLEDMAEAGISEHVQVCPHCKLELETLAQYLAQEAPPAVGTVGDRVNVLLARLMQGRGATDLGLAQAAVGTRGPEPKTQLFEAEGAQIALDTSADPNQPGKLQLLGYISGLAGGEWSTSVWSEGELLLSVPIDEAGNFILEGLPVGTYDLILTGSQTEILISDLTL